MKQNQESRGAMKIDKFMSMFDKKEVESGKIQFIFYTKSSGKLEFWAETPGTSREDIINSAMKIEEIANHDLPDEKSYDITEDDIEVEPYDDGLRIRFWLS